MSVPLDRLYQYLTSIVNHDLIIYRWTPHGSRKLEDIGQLFAYSECQLQHYPVMICHDQEPLVWGIYSREEIENNNKDRYLNSNLDYLTSGDVLAYHSQWQLRATTISFSALYGNQHDLTLLLHSEKNSQPLDKFIQNGFVPVYYWSHAVIAHDWFRYAKHDPMLIFDFKKIQKDFLIYNRAWSGTREYRLFFIELLYRYQLIACSKTSFSILDNNQDYREYQFANKNLCISNFDLHQYFDTNTADSNASADYDNIDYSQIGIEIVLETLFDDTRWHLTEKSLRPIACGKPFILAATPGSLQYLKDYGFETFSHLIDESYDSIVNPQLRLQAIAKEMQRISQLSLTERCKLYTDLDSICQRNKQHFFDGFIGQVIDEYKTNLDKAMQTMHQNCTGKHVNEIKKLLENN
jgi:hypothetical protein